jgi:hypothetical protein
MIARAGSGWQTVLADLSLILFMVMASAVNEAPAASPTPPAPVLLPALGEPIALWRQAPGGLSLPQWLASAAPDPRLRLTIMAAPQDASAALALSASAGRPARVLIEPGASGVVAALTYDQPPQLAQGLLQGDAKELAR